MNRYEVQVSGVWHEVPQTKYYTWNGPKRITSDDPGCEFCRLDDNRPEDDFTCPYCKQVWPLTIKTPIS